MTIINPYCSLVDFKNYTTSRGQTATVISDTNDDGVISDLISSVGRYIDSQTRRTFYPRYEKRWFDVPVYQNSPRMLFLDDDLLEVVTITNGDLNVVSSSVYNLVPKNYSPHYGIRIIGPTSIFWIFNSIGNIEKVISVEGWWGFHSRYDQRGWTKVGTLDSALTDTTTASFTFATGHTAAADSIVKIDTEIFNISAINSSNVATVIQRGDNGSTAATHSKAASVYVWTPQPEIRQATLEIAYSLYQSRRGQPTQGTTLNLEDVPPHAQSILTGFTRPL